MKNRYKYFRYIVIPKIFWYCGVGIIENLYSYYWLNIVKRNNIWEDASQEGCRNMWCRYCGKGRN